MEWENADKRAIYEKKSVLLLKILCQCAILEENIIIRIMRSYCLIEIKERDL